MAITKSDAIVWMAMTTGNSDGEFTEKEMYSAMLKTSYATHFQEAMDGGLSEKIDSGELNASSVISLMNQLSEEDRIEAMAICLVIVAADKVFTKEEQSYIEKLLLLMGDIDIDVVFAKFRELNSSV